VHCSNGPHALWHLGLAQLGFSAHLAFGHEAKTREGISPVAPVALLPKSRWGRQACRFHRGSIGGSWMGRGSTRKMGDVGEHGGGENLNGGADKRSLAVTLGS
jgi:hypothetical protein